ncbi:hypothetical protein HOLleu_03474 [Holothuria leucospilota]|uniref:Uncharacterized protein n=1 Tax=Holothuria leucospilota TaxID=206669 RepID=A0A9Q1CTH7_HOLLE|nr:hypothetical protein HOLleu_03474 [Holothuria leucospilota]
MADINKECQDYAREYFKDLQRTAYRVPDVLFPRDGQTGDVLTRDEIRSGLHTNYADRKHRNVSIKKLLEERHALSPVEIIVKRLYNWGTTFKEAMFVLCNYDHANYFAHVPSQKSESDGEYDIIAMGSFGFIFIQVKAFSLPTNTSIAEIIFGRP